MAKVKTYPKKCAQCDKTVYGAIQHFEHQRVHGLRKIEVPDDGITMSAAEISALQDYYYDFYGQGPWKCPECDKITDHFRNFIFHLESANDPKSRVYRSHRSSKARRSSPWSPRHHLAFPGLLGILTMATFLQHQFLRFLLPAFQAVATLSQHRFLRSLLPALQATTSLSQNLCESLM
jgi:hypothetical protein